MMIIDAHTERRRAVANAAATLREGGIIVYPTDTLYGFGAAARNRQAVARLMKIKGRKTGLVFSVMCADIDDLVRFVRVRAEYAPALERLPGPYTFIFPSKERLPDGVIGPGVGLGVRIPDCDLARSIAREFGAPVITTSVNRTGDAPLTAPEEIKRRFSNEVDLIIDAGNIVGEPSTVISFMTTPPSLIRRGAGDVDFLEMFRTNDASIRHTQNKERP
ncbi:MAG: threonylcarbamoyl-AMP synthase [Deltaproteobacteria bacterium]|nr:threonylcarbamoyl-AMP synthase [Candidatus Zymogenaceae bacterium]